MECEVSLGSASRFELWRTMALSAGKSSAAATDIAAAVGWVMSDVFTARSCHRFSRSPAVDLRVTAPPSA